MKMDRKTIIAIVLIVAALGVVVYQMKDVIMPSRPKTTAAPTAPKSKPPALVTASAKQPAAGASDVKSVQDLMAGGYSSFIASLSETDIDFSGRKFKNPMTPIVEEGGNEQPQNWVPISDDIEKPKSPPGFEELAKDDSLEGIVWNDKDPLALVNDQVVGVGEELEDGAVVTAITQDTVKFSRNGNRYYLVLREE
jgi:hypothetical protein